MKYYVAVGAQTYVVDVVGEAVTVDGVPVQAQLAAVPETPLYHLLLGSESWTVAAEPQDGAPGQWILGAVGERRPVTVVDERARQIQELTGRRPEAARGGVVRAPMPGLVLRIEVALGDRVAAGAGLVVVEAMKMENELRAPGAGVVRTIHVAEGATVAKGAPLVTLELTGF